MCNYWIERTDMGVYDEIMARPRQGQIKCWTNQLHVYHLGDMVPKVNHKETYSVAMREGGYLNVRYSRLITWTDVPMYVPVFDKYGDPFTTQTMGELDGIFVDPYFNNKP
jgi:hypothetical protein